MEGYGKKEMHDWKALEEQIHDYWFGALDNSTLLSSESAPFATQVQRWCAKEAAIDEEIRVRFEAPYRRFTESAQEWMKVTDQVRDSPRGSLALVVLLDQMSRNMYRGTARMYSHDGLALAHAYRSIEAGHAEALTLPERMFLYLPLMHAEDLTLQRISEDLFERLFRDSEKHSPQSSGFYESSLSSARRHRSVIERFGRFPHRNEMLLRTNTLKEQAALDDDDDNISF